MQTSTRTGPLLVADSVDRFQPLGAFGQPVYLSHTQLKAAVRQKLGARYANYFARPDRDPQGRAIRWLSDVPGTARRWRDLPQGEQVAAAMELHEMRGAFQGYLTELRGQPGGSREAAAFASLLENALLVPDDEHLFFVDGQPMVSFWGFRHGEGAGFDPLTVAPAIPAAAPVPASPPAAAAAPLAGGGWPWWTWALGLLALLLLLGLLLSLWRGWWPFGLSLPGFQVPGIERPDTPPVTPPDVGLPGAGLPGARVEPLRPEAGVPGVPPAVAVVPASPLVPAPAAGAPGLTTSVPEAPVPGGPERSATTPPPTTPPTTPPAPPVPDASAPQPVPVPQVPPRPSAAGAEPPALAIPPESERSGSVAFLEGWWRSGNGLVDQRDKTPLQQFYRFDQKGGGEVVVRRADGAECRAKAQAVIGATGLEVTELGDPTCPDGSTINRSRTSCRRDAAGRTECFGVNDDGSTYRVPVERLR
ncbi:SrfA family protein [Azospirillum argentinense]